MYWMVLESPILGAGVGWDEYHDHTHSSCGLRCRCGGWRGSGVCRD